MKSRIAFLPVLFFLFAVTAQAQDKPAVKIGYTNVDYIMGLLPESKQISSQLNSYQTQLQNQLKTKYQEFQDKLADYQQKASTGDMIPEVMKDKEAELSSLRESIQKFQKDADESIQKKQAELLQPEYDKIQNAIDSVALENGYSHVFTSDVGSYPVLLFVRDQDNLTDLVLLKLGIQPPPKDTSSTPENQ